MKRQLAAIMAGILLISSLNIPVWAEEVSENEVETQEADAEALADIEEVSEIDDEILIENNDTEAISEDSISANETTTEDESGAGGIENIANPRIVSVNFMEARQKVTYDCIWLGSYPQAEVVPDKSNYKAIQTRLLKKEDLIEDATLYTKLQGASYDSNNETTIDGIRYKRMQMGDATFAVSDALNYIGVEEYYDWLEDATTYHYFKYEPIKWRVIEKGTSTAFLLADKGLDDQRYNNTRTDITWKDCSLRNFLNTTFYDNAFNISEKAMIRQDKVENADSLDYGTDGGEDTYDKVFLLSEKEVYKTNGSKSFSDSSAAAHGFVDYYGISDEARRTRTTTYSKAMGDLWMPRTVSYSGNCSWYLRSPGWDSLCVRVVSDGGRVNGYGFTPVDCNITARPALKINLSSLTDSMYAGTVCTDGTVNENAKPGEGEGVSFPTVSIITKEDLYKDYPVSLVASSNTKSIYNGLIEDMSELETDYINKQSWWSSLKYSMKNAGYGNLKIMFEVGSGNDWTLTEISDCMTKEYLLKLSEYDNCTDSIRNKLQKHIKRFDKVAEALRDGANASGENENFVKQLSFARDNFTQDEVREMYMQVQKSKEFADLKAAFDKVGIAITVADFITLAYEQYELNETVISTLNKYIENDGYFKTSLNKYSRPMDNRMLSIVVLDFMKTELIEKKWLGMLANKGITHLGTWIASEYYGIGGYASSGVSLGIAKLLFYFGSYAIPCSDAEDILKCECTISNARQISGALQKERSTAMYLKDSITDEARNELMEDDEFLYNASLVALDAAYDQLTKLYASSGDKKKFEQFKAEYESKRPLLGYESNIAECKQNYIVAWTNSLKNNGTSSSSAIAAIRDIDEYELTGVNFNCDDEKLMLVVPDEVDGNTVSGIGASLFENCTRLQGISLPKSVTSIGDKAFYGCNNLLYINIEGQIETIGVKAFAGCDSLKIIDIPQSVSRIADDAFENTTDIIIRSEEGSYAEKFAKEKGIEFEQREKEVKSIKINSLPDKINYGVDEMLDTTGLKLDVVYMDGTSAVVDDGYYINTDERVMGVNTATVMLNECSTSFEYNIVESECKYTVTYVSTDNEILKEKFVAKAKTGETIHLVAPQIDGYVPDAASKDVVIGINNDFEFVYSKKNANDDSGDDSSGEGKPDEESPTQPKHNTVDIGNGYKVVYSKSVSYNGVAHIEKGGKVSASKADDVEITLYDPSGEVISPSRYKVSFKNNKDTYGIKYKKPYFTIKLKDKVDKDIKNAFKNATMEFDINPCDIGSLKLSTPVIKETKNGYKVSKLQFTNETGKVIKLKQANAKGKGDFILGIDFEGNLVLEGIGNYTGKATIKP